MIHPRRSRRPSLGLWLGVAAAIVCVAGCVHHLKREVGPTLRTVDSKTPFLKVHMRDGDLYVFDTWTINEMGHYVEGKGILKGADRVDVDRGTFRITFADVALYETNTIITSPSVSAIAIVTGLSLVGTAVCLTNPKSCFGSCPTFYAQSDDGSWVLQAEGFSDAIAPALEDHDIDALWRTTGHGGHVTLRMTNEAYETHIVKGADLLAVPRPPGGRVLATSDRLWLASRVAAPLHCAAAEGSCLSHVLAVDGDERTSLTDEADLAARETIDLEFPPVAGSAGLVIGARQSLVTTFLLYQGLSYLGDTVATWLAALTESTSRSRGRTLQHLLGGIEVQIERDGVWQTIGEAYETGPLATDVHLVMLPEGASGSRVRLRIPKGGWRIDYVALAQLAGEATPTRIAPSSIRGQLGSEFGGGRVAATAFPIVTMPGDSYELAYDLPEGGSYEVFLDSHGYYLEWMRAEWLREQNPLAALRMLLDPAEALRELAPAFKRIEPEAETLFWRSRYARP